MGELMESESRWVIAKDWTRGDGGREWLLMGRRDFFFFLSDETVLKLIVVMIA